MKYSHDMTQEKGPQPLIAEGWHAVEVIGMVEKTSKAGNLMFSTNFALADAPDVTTDAYLVAEQGKRWMLKQLLKACGVEPNGEGVFEWEPDGVIGKTVEARIEHRKETWTDREGTERETTKAKIAEFRRVEVR